MNSTITELVSLPLFSGMSCSFELPARPWKPSPDEAEYLEGPSEPSHPLPARSIENTAFSPFGNICAPDEETIIGNPLCGTFDCASNAASADMASARTTSSAYKLLPATSSVLCESEFGENTYQELDTVPFCQHAGCVALAIEATSVTVEITTGTKLTRSLPSLRLISPTQSTELLSPIDTRTVTLWASACFAVAATASCEPPSTRPRPLAPLASLPLVAPTASTELLDTEAPADWEAEDWEAGCLDDSALQREAAQALSWLLAAAPAARVQPLDAVAWWEEEEEEAVWGFIPEVEAEAGKAAARLLAAAPEQPSGDDSALALLRARFYRCLGRQPPSGSCSLPAHPCTPPARTAPCSAEEDDDEAASCGSCGGSAYGSPGSSAASSTACSPLSGSPVWSRAGSRNGREEATAAC